MNIEIKRKPSKLFYNGGIFSFLLWSVIVEAQVWELLLVAQKIWLYRRDIQ